MGGVRKSTVMPRGPQSFLLYTSFVFLLKDTLRREFLSRGWGWMDWLGHTYTHVVGGGAPSMEGLSLMATGKAPNQVWEERRV